MVEVGVCQQDAVEALEADATAQDLPLGAFAAVDEEAILAREYRGGAQPAIDGRGRGRRSQKD